MAVSVSITRVVKEAAPSTRVLVTYDDGSGEEFSSLQAVQGILASTETPELARRLALARMLAISSDLSNTTPIVGKTCTLDLNAVNIFRVQ